MGCGGKSTGAQPGPAQGKEDPYGRGEFDEATGLWEWYEYPSEAERQRSQGKGLTWARLLEHWPLIEADMHQTYGVDVGSSILLNRTWRWLSVRIVQLLTEESTRLHRAIYPQEQKGTQK